MSIIDFNKGKRLLAKKKSEKDAMIASAKAVIASRPCLPQPRSFEDYTFDEKIEACLKQRWSLQTYINEVSLDRAINRMRTYDPDGYGNKELEKIIPYEQWVIKKLAQLYPDEAKLAKVVSITSG